MLINICSWPFEHIFLTGKVAFQCSYTHFSSLLPLFHFISLSLPHRFRKRHCAKAQMWGAMTYMIRRLLTLWFWRSEILGKFQSRSETKQRWMPLWCVCCTATVVCMRECSIFYGCLTCRMRALVVHLYISAWGLSALLVFDLQGRS